MRSRHISTFGFIALGLLTLVTSPGCTSIPDRETVSPTCFTNGQHGGPRSQKESINFIRLRQDPPPVYVLGPEDTLGIYIEGVLGNRDEAPPVHFPDETSNLPPAIGFPIPIREDGTLSLPHIPPLMVAGLTLAQAEREIRRAYTVTQRILVPGRDRIIITLLRERTYQVMVVREDTVSDTRSRQLGKGELIIGGSQRGSTEIIELPAYENDVLHALSRSGGLPGLEAKNELVILRGSFDEASGSNAVLNAYYETGSFDALGSSNPNILRIPMRAAPGEQLPILTQEDIILNDGDIVFIESRDAEVFYTGGLLAGGQHAIPRDFDLDVLGAMAMSGGSVAAAAGGSGANGRGAGVGSIFPPTRVLVLRMVNGQQNAIRIDLKRALGDPSQRILIEKDDFIVLEYTTTEMLMNTILSTVQINLNANDLFQ